MSELSAEVIQKYKQRSTSSLKEKAKTLFHKWIRERDIEEGCISCGKFAYCQAGHYHSAGNHNHLRFNPDNVNGQCVRCNYHLHGNAIHYRTNLIKKIGVERVEKLDRMAATRAEQKDNRLFYIEVIEKYK